MKKVTDVDKFTKSKALSLAKKLVKESMIQEPNITKDMLDLQKKGIKIVGLNNKIKNIDSLTRKIITDSLIENITINEASNKISDVIRYTLVIDNDIYSKEIKNILDTLKNKGYIINKFKNYWGNQKYQGINVSLSINNVKFELQFHTSESYYIKENITHVHYEKEREYIDNNYGNLFFYDYSNINIPSKILGYDYLNSNIR